MISRCSPARLGPAPDEPDPRDDELREDPRLTRLNSPTLKVYETLRSRGCFQDKRVPLNSADIGNYTGMSESDTCALLTPMWCHRLLDRDQRYPRGGGQLRFHYWLSDYNQLEEDVAA